MHVSLLPFPLPPSFFLLLHFSLSLSAPLPEYRAYSLVPCYYPSLAVRETGQTAISEFYRYMLLLIIFHLRNWWFGALFMPAASGDIDELAESLARSWAREFWCGRAQQFAPFARDVFNCPGNFEAAHSIYWLLVLGHKFWDFQFFLRLSFSFGFLWSIFFEPSILIYWLKSFAMLLSPFFSHTHAWLSP